MKEAGRMARNTGSLSGPVAVSVDGYVGDAGVHPTRGAIPGICGRSVAVGSCVVAKGCLAGPRLEARHRWRSARVCRRDVTPWFRAPEPAVR